MIKCFGILLTAAITLSSMHCNAFAKEKNAEVKKASNQSFEEIYKASLPNENQLLLSKLIGEWGYSVSVWAEGSPTPEKSTGTSINEMILGDRFLSIKLLGIINIGGSNMPYQSNGLIGYDNIKGIYSSVWVDDVNPGMMIGQGAYNKKAMSINEAGQFSSSIEKSAKKYRAEITFTDDGGFKRTIFSHDKSGKEYKFMEFVFYRSMGEPNKR